MLSLNAFHISLFENIKDASVKVSIENKSLVFRYPCAESNECTEYELTIPPGFYKIEAYGASGGYLSRCLPTAKKLTSSTCVSSDYVSIFKGNSSCVTSCTASGSGGYTSGLISLRSKTKAYIAIGGEGLYKTGSCSKQDKTSPDCFVEGGFNGGGKSYIHTTGDSSGGGATDIRFETNDLFHRVLVAGAGGGSDNIEAADGFGGSGGGLKTQGFWVSNNLKSEYFSDQLSGFSFGYGESGSVTGSSHPNGSSYNSGAYDLAGAGGGWFGGFASNNNNGGASGGSSFLLTNDAIYPEGEIIVNNSENIEVTRGYYAFRHQSKYIFDNALFGEGVWRGNGLVRITPLNFLLSQCIFTSNSRFSPLLCIHLFLSIFLFE